MVLERCTNAVATPFGVTGAEEDLTGSIEKHIERDASPLQLNKEYWAKRQDKVEITKAKKTIVLLDTISATFYFSVWQMFQIMITLCLFLYFAQ